MTARSRIPGTRLKMFDSRLLVAIGGGERVEDMSESPTKPGVRFFDGYVTLRGTATRVYQGTALRICNRTAAANASASTTAQVSSERVKRLRLDETSVGICSPQLYSLFGVFRHSSAAEARINPAGLRRG